MKSVSMQKHKPLKYKGGEIRWEDWYKGGHWLLQRDDVTGEEIWQEISKEEWDWIWKGGLDKTPTYDEIKARLREVYTKYGLYADIGKPRTKSLWDDL